MQALGMEMIDLFAAESGQNSKPHAAAKKKKKFYASPEQCQEALGWVLHAAKSRGWLYHDRDSAMHMVVYRFDFADKPKTYRPCYRTPAGWVIGDPPGKLPLYHLPELANTQRVYILEGEKCADLARRLGVIATTSAHGAEAPGKTDWGDLAGKDIVIFPDKNPPNKEGIAAGEAYAKSVCTLLAGLSPRPQVRIVRLADMWKTDAPVPVKGDIEQWLADGVPAEWTDEQRRTALEQAADAAPLVDLDAVAVVEAPDDPHRLARSFINGYFRTDDGISLVYHQQNFYRHDGSAYIAYKDIQSDLVAYIKACFDGDYKLDLAIWTANHKKDELPPTVRKVTTTVVKNTVQALGSETVLSWDASAPCWIDPTPADAEPLNILPACNGLVDLDTLAIRAHTPRFFSPLVLDYDFSLTPPRPTRFEAFLREIWPDDPESIRELMKWFGYLITPDTRQQKILLLIGPLRSGKGTLLRVLRHMLGERNVVSPSLASLGSNFGLWPLVDKTAAFITDARVSWSTSDRSAIVERLLNISGEDDVTVDRKYLQPVTLKLMTRLVVATNEMPNFRDQSGALARRFVPLVFTRSWLGKEDPRSHSKTHRRIARHPSMVRNGRTQNATGGRAIHRPEVSRRHRK